MEEKKPQAGAMTAMASNGQPITVIVQQPDNAGAGARAMAEGRALQLDTVAEGGKYRNASGVLVDANGEPFKGKDE